MGWSLCLTAPRPRTRSTTNCICPWPPRCIYPTLLFSAEDNDIIADIGADIIDYNEKMRAKWLAYGGVEDEWEDYLKKLDSMGLQQYIDIYQKTYDTAYGK